VITLTALTIIDITNEAVTAETITKLNNYYFILVYYF